MKKKTKKNKKWENRVCSQVECPRGKFLRQCRNALLITASYQIFSVCLNPANINDPLVGPGQSKNLLTTVSEQIASVFINPALAQRVPPVSPGKCVMWHDRTGGRGCSGCTGCTYCTYGIGCTGCTGGCTGCTECTGCTGCTGVTSSDYSKQSFELNKQGRHQEAEEAARQAIMLNPQNAVAYNNLCAALFRQGRYKEAEEAARQAITLKPQLESAQKWLAKIESNKEGYKRMEEMARKMVAESPSRNNYLALASALKLQERHEEANAARQKADQLSPIQPLQEAQKLNEEGSQYYLNKQWKEATEAFKKALEKCPDNEEIRSNYELAFGHLTKEARKGGNKEALKQLESAKYHGAKAAAEKVTDQDITVNPRVRETPMEGARAEASKPFDTPVQDVGTTLKPGAVKWGWTGKEPVIPKEKRTKAITILEEKRDEAKNKRIELEPKVLQLENKEQKTPEETKQLVQYKQWVSDLKQVEEHYNFAINEGLKSPKDSNVDNGEKFKVSQPKKVTDNEED
jgi:tetratricopeptide (TPR) repeat protein